jgi:hypothetical protein
MGKPAFPPQGVGTPVFCVREGFTSLLQCRGVSLRSTGQPRRLSLREFLYFRRSRSAAMNKAKTTEITPFMVKKAALSLERSLGLIRECS